MPQLRNQIRIKYKTYFIDIYTKTILGVEKFHVQTFPLRLHSDYESYEKMVDQLFQIKEFVDKEENEIEAGRKIIMKAVENMFGGNYEKIDS